MTIASRFRDTPLEPLVRHGIVVAMYPSSDPAFDVELHRSRGSSASTSFQEIAQLNGIGLRTYQFTDILPSDNITTWYKARHVLPGYTDGAFTTAVRAKPSPLLNSPLRDKYPQLEISGRPLNADIQISSAATINVGTPTVPGSISKTIYYPPMWFLGLLSTGTQVTYEVGGAALVVKPSVGAAGSTQVLGGPVVLPPGVTITRMTAFLQNPSSNAKAELTLVRSTTVLATLSQTGGGGGVVTSSVMSHAYNSTNAYAYALRLKLRTTAGSGSDAVFNYATITYTMPSYDKSL